MIFPIRKKDNSITYTIVFSIIMVESKINLPAQNIFRQLQ